MATKKKMKAPVGKDLAKLCAGAADDTKAHDIMVLDMRGLSSITDYFVICSGTSDRHVKAISESIEIEVKKRSARCYRSEGRNEARWIVLDFVDVIVHVFLDETRRYYGIERLWGDAKLITNNQ